MISMAHPMFSSIVALPLISIKVIIMDKGKITSKKEVIECLLEKGVIEVLNKM